MPHSFHRSPLPNSSAMSDQMYGNSMASVKSKAPLSIALIYIVVAATYIAVSDHLANALAQSREALTMISQLKGWGFVLSTGLLLYAMLRRHAAMQEDMQETLRRNIEQFDHVIASSPAYLFEIDASGTILFATRPLPGSTTASPVGMNIAALFPSITQERLQAAIADVRRRLSASSLGCQTTMASGGTRIFSVTVSPFAARSTQERLLVTAMEITPLRKAEATVHFQSRLLDAVDQAVIAADLEGTITYWNRAAARMYGWSGEEIIGKNIVSIVLDESAQGEAQGIMACLREGRTYSREFPVKTKDGKTLPAFVSLSPIREEGGAISGIISVSFDLTAQKYAEEELKKWNQRFTLIAKASKDAVWDWDLTTNKLWWSETYFRTYGYPEQTEGTLSAWEMHIHPEDRERVVRGLEAAIANKAPAWSDEYRFQHADGSTSYVVDRGFVLYDDAGTPVRMLGSMVNMTSLKLAELDQRYLAEERQKLIQQLRFQFERMPIGYLVLDPHAQITEWNPACERMFGYSRADVIGRSIYELIIAPSARSSHFQFLQEVKAGTETLTATHEHVTKEGRTILCEWFDTPMHEEDGTLRGIMAMVQDVTDRRRAEEELKNSNIKLRHLSAYLQSVREEERKHIAREIHDELGQELTALKMQAAFLQKAITRLETASPKRELLELTTSLITMSDAAIKTVRRIATELRPDVLDKMGLIDALKWQAQEFQKRTGVPCTFTSRFDQWEFPDEIATALFRIFQEALTNVSRHAAATRVSAELALSDGWVELRVQDNGRGITQQEMENTSSLGLLGLTERAHLLGGTVAISGVQGAGTTIRVCVPVPYITFEPEPYDSRADRRRSSHGTGGTQKDFERRIGYSDRRRSAQCARNPRPGCRAPC